MSKIKLGIIGGGTNSAVGAAHLSAIRLTGKFEVVAGCFSREIGAGVASAMAYDVPRAYGQIDTVVNDPAVERVVVLSPTPQHFDHCLAALRSEKPVLCEKALGISAEQTANLWRISQEHAPLACVYNYCFYPAVRALRELLQAGDLGDLLHVLAEMPQSGYLRARPQEWRVTDRGVFLDLGTHLHQLIWFLTGEHPTHVTAVQSRQSDVGVIDYTSALLDYRTFHAHLWYSKCSAGHTNGLRIRLYGTEGSAEWHQREPDMLRCAAAETFDGKNAVACIEVPNPRFKLGHPTGYVEALANLYETWADNPSLPELAPTVAHQGLLLMHAIEVSAVVQGARVPV